MDKQIKTHFNKDSQSITPEKALELFSDKFFELHPKESLPKWFTSHTDLTQICTENPNQRIFAIAAAKKKDLSPNEWYEEIRGIDVLAKKIPGTHNTGYVINHEPKILTIFSAAINLLTSDVSVLVDEDMFLIDVEKLMKLR